MLHSGCSALNGVNPFFFSFFQKKKKKKKKRKKDIEQILQFEKKVDKRKVYHIN